MAEKPISPIGDLLFNTGFKGHGLLFYGEDDLSDLIVSDPTFLQRHKKNVKSVKTILYNVKRGIDRVSPNTQVDLEHAIRKRLEADPDLAQQVVDRMYALTRNDAQHLRTKRGFRVGRGAAKATLG